VPSVSGEQALKPISPRVPAWGRERTRFLGSIVATARRTSSSLYARCSPISIDGLLLLPLCRQPYYKDVFLLLVVRSRNLSFLLLALDAMILSQILVLVLIYIYVIHVIGLFLIVEINLYIAKLLLFPTLMCAT